MQLWPTNHKGAGRAVSTDLASRYDSKSPLPHMRLPQAQCLCTPQDMGEQQLHNVSLQGTQPCSHKQLSAVPLHSLVSCSHAASHTASGTDAFTARRLARCHRAAHPSDKNAGRMHERTPCCTDVGVVCLQTPWSRGAGERHLQGASVGRVLPVALSDRLEGSVDPGLQLGPRVQLRL